MKTARLALRNFRQLLLAYIADTPDIPAVKEAFSQTANLAADMNQAAAVAELVGSPGGRKHARAIYDKARDCANLFQARELFLATAPDRIPGRRSGNIIPGGIAKAVPFDADDAKVRCNELEAAIDQFIEVVNAELGGAPIDSAVRLAPASGMTASKPSGQQPPEDNTALLTAALDHAWTWYDEHMKRVFQLINFYIVATALLVTAYANSINGKHYGFAIALAVVGLALTAIASASALNQATAGGKAQDALRDMEGRIACRLGADSISIVKHQGGIRYTPVAAGITVGLGAGLFVAALIYAAIQ